MRIFEWPQDRGKILKIFSAGGRPSAELERSVAGILRTVEREGDKAVARFTRRFDGVELKANQFEIPKREWEAAWHRQPPALRRALQMAARRIEAFHKKQRLAGWTLNDPALGRMELRVQ